MRQCVCLCYESYSAETAACRILNSTKRNVCACSTCSRSTRQLKQQLAHLQDVEQHHFIAGWAGRLKLALRGVLNNGIHCLWRSVSVQTCGHTARQRVCGTTSQSRVATRLAALAWLHHRALPSGMSCVCCNAPLEPVRYQKRKALLGGCMS